MSKRVFSLKEINRDFTTGLRCFIDYVELDHLETAVGAGPDIRVRANSDYDDMCGFTCLLFCTWFAKPSFIPLIMSQKG